MKKNARGLTADYRAFRRVRHVHWGQLERTLHKDGNERSYLRSNSFKGSAQSYSQETGKKSAWRLSFFACFEMPVPRAHVGHWDRCKKLLNHLVLCNLNHDANSLRKHVQIPLLDAQDSLRFVLSVSRGMKTWASKIELRFTPCVGSSASSSW